MLFDIRFSSLKSIQSLVNSDSFEVVGVRYKLSNAAPRFEVMVAQACGNPDHNSKLLCS